MSRNKIAPVISKKIPDVIPPDPVKRGRGGERERGGSAYFKV